jgi:hypothetical protein
MSKYFYSKEKFNVDGGEIAKSHQDLTQRFGSDDENKRAIREKTLRREFNIDCVPGRVVILVDMEQKNYHTFSNGQVISHQRDWNNLNRVETQQVLGVVINGDNIPKGALILFHHNATHEVNHLNDHSELTTEEYAAGVRIISIEEEMCFLWKMPEESDWKPTKNFCIAERVFEPYRGLLVDILPKKVKDVLWIKTGELANHVCRTLIACDFPIIFRNEKGVEETLIRCRHYEDEFNEEREELIAIDHGMTARVLCGDLLIGIDEKTAKPLI